VNDIVAEFMRALNAAGLGWSSRLGPDGTLPDIRADAECDEYGQSPEGALLHKGCMPAVLQIFKDKYRAVVLEAPACTPEQAEELAASLWELLSAEISGRNCSLTRAMLDQLGRPQSWHLPIERARGGSGRNDRKMVARTSARSQARSMERSARRRPRRPAGTASTGPSRGSAPSAPRASGRTRTRRATPTMARARLRGPARVSASSWPSAAFGSGNETEGTGGETDGEA